jgi:acyl dehydratase
MEMRQIPFGEIAAIQEMVSDEWSPWGPEMLFDQERINKFADATGDHQWIHVDVERAKSLGGTIAHGYLTLSCMFALMSQVFELTGSTMVFNLGGSQRFTDPVPSGSKVHMRARLKSVENKMGGTFLTTEYEIWVVDAEKAAVKGTVNYLYR